MKKLRLWCATVVCALFVPIVIEANENEALRRADWNQDEAAARVKQVLKIEDSGDLPWDDIAWETDVDKAIERSEKENKPLFVYMFLKKNVGPENAPC